MPAEFTAWLPPWQELAMKIARALVIAATFEVFTYIASWRMGTVLREVYAADAHRDPARRSRRRAKLRAAVRGLSRAVFYPLAFLVMLEIFGVPPMTLGVAYVSGVAGALVSGRAWLQDVMAGLVILGEDQFAVGDSVRLGDVEGIVDRMSLRSTWVRAEDQQVHIIANRLITRTRIKGRTPTSG